MVPPPSNPHEIQQLLSFLLSQPGPNSVPYEEPAKWLIQQHLLNLTSSYPFLTPKTAAFMHNDGRSVNLLQADGTIPMVYHGVTYNIPVIIWLLESYPYHPPFVYVNPTDDMIIKQPHAHVTPSGLVLLPYLHNWVYPSSNLVDLVSELSAAFACDPPLYSRHPPDQSFSTTPSPYQHVHHQQSNDVAEVFKKTEAEEKVRLEQQLQGKMLEGTTALDLPIEDNSFQHGVVAPFDPYNSRYVKRMLLREQQFNSFPFMG